MGSPNKKWKEKRNIVGSCQGPHEKRRSRPNRNQLRHFITENGPKMPLQRVEISSLTRPDYFAELSPNKTSQYSRPANNRKWNMPEPIMRTRWPRVHISRKRFKNRYIQSFLAKFTGSVYLCLSELETRMCLNCSAGSWFTQSNEYSANRVWQKGTKINKWTNRSEQSSF